MGALQLDWYWAAIGMLSAYLLGHLRGYKQTKAFAEAIVQRTVTSLRPPPPSYRETTQQELRELADAVSDRSARETPQGRRRRSTRDEDNDGE